MLRTVCRLIFDPELPEFPDYSCVAEARSFGDLDHQLPDLSRFSLASLGILVRFRLFLLQPAVERGGMDDGDQLLDGPADLLPQGDQFIPFVRSGMNLPLDSRPQDLILRLQKLNVLGQFPIRGRGNQGQEWVENSVHRGMVVTSYPAAV